MTRVEVRYHPGHNPGGFVVGWLCGDGGRVWAEPSDPAAHPARPEWDAALRRRDLGKLLTHYGPGPSGEVHTEDDLRWVARTGILAGCRHSARVVTPAGR